jgi:hypothetical protein
LGKGIILASIDMGNYALNEIYVDPYAITEDLITPNDLGVSMPGNSMGFRCSEFKKEHKNTHILFSGCSQTVGQGLDHDELWSFKVYNKITRDNMTSEFYNLAISGSSLPMACLNIIKYCSKYSKPDIVFLNCPPYNRFWNAEINNNKVQYKTYIFDFYDNLKENDLTLLNLKLLSYHYYYLLEQYCLSNNIRLYSFAWGTDNLSVNSDKNFNFKTFYRIDKKEMLKFLHEYQIDNPNDEFALVARDGVHLGTAFNEYWTQFILKKYYGIYDGGLELI